MRSTDWNITERTQSLLCLIGLVEAMPAGATAKELSKKVALSLARTKNLLTYAGRNGMLERVRDGLQWRWVAPQNKQRLCDALADAARRQDRAENDESEGQPIRRRASASAPLPFTLRAPASVFDLGAML